MTFATGELQLWDMQPSPPAPYADLFAPTGTVRASNRFGIDYVTFAQRLGPPPVRIFDFHSHVNGADAALIWGEAADTFGVHEVLTMVPLHEAGTVKRVLGNRVGFIAFPNFRAPDRGHAMREGFLEDIRRFHGELGSKMIKLWNAPRLREFFPGDTGLDLIEFDGASRVKQVELAAELGMGVMVHIADPDTWFATKYSNQSVYGTKRDAYRGLKVMLSRYPHMPWVAAHMAGFPEDIEFLSELLEAHPNLCIDCSATKWIVRELSKHPPEKLRAFFSRWKGRILFGSDIVTTQEHLVKKEVPPAHPMGDLADSPASAFDLYASRYAALRLLLETSYDGLSPISDPDLTMVWPDRFTPSDAPPLRGAALDSDTLHWLYRRSGEQLMQRLAWTFS
jgi:hypothetical protein